MNVIQSNSQVPQLKYQKLTRIHAFLSKIYATNFLK